MKNIIFILICMSCVKENIIPTQHTTAPAGSTEKVLGCADNLFFASLLEAQNDRFQENIVLIHLGALPDSGCDRLNSQSCTEQLQKKIDFNKIIIRNLKRDCQ